LTSAGIWSILPILHEDANPALNSVHPQLQNSISRICV